MEATSPLAVQVRATGWMFPALLTLPLALAFWTLSFAWQPINFWVLMGVATGTLGAVSVLLGVRPFDRLPTAGDIAIGVASGIALYGVFWVGDKVATAILPFAPEQVSDIYDLRSRASLIRIGLLLALVVGPGEEIYWRGLVQSAFVRRWGVVAGTASAIAAYAGVHLVAGNLMIVVAAGVAGTAWAAIYAWRGNLWPVLISHVLWDLMIFIWFPIT